MDLVQILLPVFDNTGARFHDERFSDVRRELTERFGGVTAYLRSPAAGLWQRQDGSVDRDEMVMIEVMVDRLDRDWWANYRVALERRFAQDAVLVRSMAIQQL